MEKFQKIIKAYREERLALALKSKLSPYSSALRSIFTRSSEYNISLNSFDFVNAQTSENEIKIVERIFQSLKKMKEDQAQTRDFYKPAKLWADQLRIGYRPIYESLELNDITKLHYFLANFGSWDKYTGVSANMLMRQFKKSFLGRRYLRNIYFHNHIKLWSWLNGERGELETLSCPNFGNQSGAFCDKTFIVPSSCPNEFNAELLVQYLCGSGRKIVGELGGGCGQFAYYLLKKTFNTSYVNFDLPETICLAAYYLMLCFPEKKALLYGEDEFNSGSLKNYDLIFMPSFEIEKLEESTIDLFINKNSLGEMEKNASENYIRFILSSTNYFFHMNHDIYRNIFSISSSSALSHEFPVSSKNFDLMFRYPDIWHMLQNRKIDFYMDIFMYLYKRRNY